MPGTFMTCYGMDNRSEIDAIIGNPAGFDASGNRIGPPIGDAFSRQSVAKLSAGLQTTRIPYILVASRRVSLPSPMA